MPDRQLDHPDSDHVIERPVDAVPMYETQGWRVKTKAKDTGDSSGQQAAKKTTASKGGSTK